ncbi:MAG: prepilin-type N-terminal cleavage/methylation domain-containing protein, partial [Campylobacteraceae bacterium]|nr:prepilin-type N-terminal cleavage/methylation domain-containing protein [Campylobacteraceae bacterium]
MKKGFTMIELIFVIVILGILAAVAIPRLAATRDDAKAASIKTDIGTAMQAVPAWYQGQKEASFLNAMSLDTNVWVASTNTPDTECKYEYNDQQGGTISMEIRAADANETSPTGFTELTIAAVKCNETNATKLGTAPYLKIGVSKGTAGIVKTRVDTMGVNDANINLGGR